jgi:hypothetical protein
MTGWNVPALMTRVWQRYGQLRIYVSAGRADVAWCDPRSGASSSGDYVGRSLSSCRVRVCTVAQACPEMPG